MQVRLLRAEFAVNPRSGYNTLEDFWDGVDMPRIKEQGEGIIVHS
jgi:hypothetical protein